MDPSGSNSSHFAYSLVLQLLQFLNNPLFHQIQNTVKLTFCLQSHTATTTALLTQVSIRAAHFCQQKPFSSYMYFFISVLFLLTAILQFINFTAL